MMPKAYWAAALPLIGAGFEAGKGFRIVLAVVQRGTWRQGAVAMGILAAVRLLWNSMKQSGAVEGICLHGFLGLQTVMSTKDHDLIFIRRQGGRQSTGGTCSAFSTSAD
jgi:hypothetical protein